MSRSLGQMMREAQRKKNAEAQIETSEPKSPESCHGTTAAGKPCGAKPVEDSLFCRHHQPKSDEEE